MSLLEMYFDKNPYAPSYNGTSPVDEVDYNDEGVDDFYDDGYSDNDGYGHSKDDEDIFGDEDDEDDSDDEESYEDDWSME